MCKPMITEIENQSPIVRTKRRKSIATKQDVKIFSLGGLSEIGKNMYVVEYAHQIVVIDAGVMFPRSDMPGIDYIIPNFEYLIQNRDKVKGIFLTHGHEDHIGGLPYVLKELNVPVYGAPLTIGLVRAKLEEHKLDKQAMLHVINEDSVIDLGPLRVHFFRTTHSIPDSLGVVVETPQGTIVHTGDFKFDMSPVDHPADLHKMAELGRNGVLALLSDSTNSEKPGFSPSEKTVGKAILDTFLSCKGRILFATFASNVHRLQQVVEAADLLNRHLVVLGRSMERVFRIGQELGIIRIPKGLLIDVKEIHKYTDNQLVILCTGSQGEINAALSRIASGRHAHVHIHDGDTVVFSSSPIPGNTQNINRTIDLLFRSGAHVIYGSLIDIHTSGHGCQEDLKLMLNMVKPRYFIPIHGEYRMLVQHANLAERMGISHDRIFILDLGQTVKISSDRAAIGPKVPSGQWLVRGSHTGYIHQDLLDERNQMSSQGIIMVVVVLNTASTIVAGPELISRGFIYVRESTALIREATSKTKKILEKILSRQPQPPLNRLEHDLKQALSSYFVNKVNRNPIILPVISMKKEIGSYIS
ncbi:ribonuclease J [Paenibacillus alginolyticus]|nr:ribonuclease J [Paenibacillus alginolyticus]